MSEKSVHEVVILKKKQEYSEHLSGHTNLLQQKDVEISKVSERLRVLRKEKAALLDDQNSILAALRLLQEIELGVEQLSVEPKNN